MVGAQLIREKGLKPGLENVPFGSEMVDINLGFWDYRLHRRLPRKGKISRQIWRTSEIWRGGRTAREQRWGKQLRLDGECGRVWNLNQMGSQSQVRRALILCPTAILFKSFNMYKLSKPHALGTGTEWQKPAMILPFYKYRLNMKTNNEQ